MQLQPNYLSIIGSLLKSVVQMVRGLLIISRVPRPIVTIFGGARLAQTSPYAQQAHELARLLIEHNISVITGGGPGIMQAASCGAFHAVSENKAKSKSVTIGVKGLEQVKTDFLSCADVRIEVDEFYARKWLMFEPALAFAVFPGGFGTLDEIGDVITLMQTKKMIGRPVVMIGVEFWRPIISWLENEALKQKAVSEDDIRLLRVTDDINQAMGWLHDHCKMCMVK